MFVPPKLLSQLQEQQLQRWNEARTWDQHSLEMWQTIHNPGARTPAGLACGNPKTVAVARQIARCDAALVSHARQIAEAKQRAATPASQ
jgi:hypothetical protein